MRIYLAGCGLVAAVLTQHAYPIQDYVFVAAPWWWYAKALGQLVLITGMVWGVLAGAGLALFVACRALWQLRPK